METVLNIIGIVVAVGYLCILGVLVYTGIKNKYFNNEE